MSLQSMSWEVDIPKLKQLRLPIRSISSSSSELITLPSVLSYSSTPLSIKLPLMRFNSVPPLHVIKIPQQCQHRDIFWPSWSTIRPIDEIMRNSTSKSYPSSISSISFEVSSKDWVSMFDFRWEVLQQPPNRRDQGERICSISKEEQRAIETTILHSVLLSAL
jgi:hypothetical protein